MTGWSGENGERNFFSRFGIQKSAGNLTEASQYKNSSPGFLAEADVFQALKMTKINESLVLQLSRTLFVFLICHAFMRRRYFLNLVQAVSVFISKLGLNFF
ncbi:MAG: hypothetical protein Q7R66_10070 [Undibacterium sp.]|uniref:hypothetical protein n=1 Tax=Undibacterium sp. TaxID=1914977 RepID=UPI0027188B68|nr:hypothetical protein [Undibacterium sp.]MDO8652525.1 hypothetical protein [Undibacterium sp.]